jgi:putative tricarboxylic transport membrane protein
MMRGQIALSGAVCVVGLLVLTGAFALPDQAGYSTVGPAVVPKIVGMALIAVGAMLIHEVMRGGFRNHDEKAERELGMDWVAFARISAGIVLYGGLIEHAGFVVSSWVLFLCTAKGFGCNRWLRNGGIALVMAIVIYLIFNRGLGLNLPAGVLKGLM